MISVPEQLCCAAEMRFTNRFGSIDELVTEMLQELLRDSTTVLDQNEQQIIEERLKGLGYV